MGMNVEHLLLGPNQIENKALEEAGLTLFKFPSIDLGQTTLPGLDAEVSWLRRHVEEGSINGKALTLHEKTVFVDMQPCPGFLLPYGENDLLGPVLSAERESGNIPRELLWGTDVGIKLPANSRWGVSPAEIESLIIPKVKDVLKTEKTVRLPTVAEMLYLKSRGKIFDKYQLDYALAPKEWTADHFCSAHNLSNPIGRLVIAAGVRGIASRGVSWWGSIGKFNRLPTLGFRLVVEAE